MRIGPWRGGAALDPSVIVTVVLNEVESDDRVLRVASTLAAHGSQVTALGVTSKRGWERRIGDVFVRVIGAPPPPTAPSRPVRLAQRLIAPLTGVLSGLVERVGSKRTTRVRRSIARLLSASLDGLVRLSVSLGERSLRRARRRHPPAIWDRLARELARLRPVAIHANDADGLAVAVAARRALSARPAIIYDAHEWMVGRAAYIVPPPDGVPSEVELEETCIDEADAVVTVSREMAEALESRYRLPRAPIVLHNAPLMAWGEIEAPSLRALAGIGADVPLLAYVGNIAPVRGVLDVVEALPLLPGEIHFALLGWGRGDEVLDLAAQQGVSERVHVVDPVLPEQIVPTIRDATLGLNTMRRNPNYDRTLPRKIFQYLHAGLPMVVSDCPSIAGFVHEHGLGEVFTAGDPASFAEAVRRALERREELRERLQDAELRRQFSWDSQEADLVSVYRDLGVLPDPNQVEATRARSLSAERT